MTDDLVKLFDCDETQLRKLVGEALAGADDGELFIEHAQAESLTFDNGRLKGGSFNTDQGFGLRAVAGETVGYAHAGELQGALKRASMQSALSPAVIPAPMPPRPSAPTRNFTATKTRSAARALRRR